MNNNKMGNLNPLHYPAMVLVSHLAKIISRSDKANIYSIAQARAQAKSMGDSITFKGTYFMDSNVKWGAKGIMSYFDLGQNERQVKLLEEEGKLEGRIYEGEIISSVSGEIGPWNKINFQKKADTLNMSPNKRRDFEHIINYSGRKINDIYQGEWSIDNHGPLDFVPHGPFFMKKCSE